MPSQVAVMAGTFPGQLTGIDDVRRRFILILFEILQKELRQFRHLHVEISFTRPPRFPWIENVRGNTGDGCWDLKIEDFINFVFGLG